MTVSKQKLTNYNSVRGAEAYKSDYKTKLHRKLSDRAERAIYAGFFRQLGQCETALDLPCGAGRLCSLIQAHSTRVIEADWSETMLRLNRKDNKASAYLRCTGLEIPMSDDAVDLIVSIRLSHHIHTHEGREQHMSELFRVARRSVIVSWFSATSLKAVLRRWRARFQNKQPKNTLHNQVVARIADRHGFKQADARMISRLGSGHVFGLFCKD